MVSTQHGLHRTEGRRIDDAEREHRTTGGCQSIASNSARVIARHNTSLPLNEPINKASRTASNRFRVEPVQLLVIQLEVDRLAALLVVEHVHGMGAALVTRGPHSNQRVGTTSGAINEIAHVHDLTHGRSTSRRRQAGGTQGRQVAAGRQRQITIDHGNVGHIFIGCINLESVSCKPSISTRSSNSTSAGRAASGGSSNTSKRGTQGKHQVTALTFQTRAGLRRPHEGLVVRISHREAAIGHVIRILVEERPVDRANTTTAVDQAIGRGVGRAVVNHIRDHHAVAERAHRVSLGGASTQYRRCGNGGHCKFFHL